MIVETARSTFGARSRDRGVLTFCYGPEKYRDQAISLARSIRLRDRDIPLAVATDRDARDFSDLFDIVIPFDFDPWPGTTAKLALCDITPFETTLFIDCDCLSMRKIGAVFDYFGAADFAVYGGNAPDYPWADGDPGIRAIVDAPHYPAFNGGVYFFRQSAVARDVLARAAAYSADYDSLGLKRPRGRHNDELLVSLAMASLGLRANDSRALRIMAMPDPADRTITIDVLRGHAAFTWKGARVEPEIVHFVGARDRLPLYRREQLVLKYLAGRGRAGALRPLLGYYAAAEDFARRVWSKVRAILARV